jgi:hypothetical protein
VVYAKELFFQQGTEKINFFLQEFNPVLILFNQFVGQLVYDMVGFSRLMAIVKYQVIIKIQ